MADIITPNDFKRGMCIRYKGQIVEVVSYARGRTGMRRPYVNTKMKSIESGRVFEDTFSSDAKFETVYMERKAMQYLYRAGDRYVFMDNETYEQPEIEGELVESIADLLRENDTAFVQIAEGKIIGLSLPDFIELKVTEAEPYLKGDTATAEYRKVVVETGATIMAPTHIKEGDTISIDTRSREYIKRVSN